MDKQPAPTLNPLEALRSWLRFWRERATDPQRTDFTMEQSTLLRILEYLVEQADKEASDGK